MRKSQYSMNDKKKRYVDRRRIRYYLSRARAIAPFATKLLVSLLHSFSRPVPFNRQQFPRREGTIVTSAIERDSSTIFSNFLEILWRMYYTYFGIPNDFIRRYFLIFDMKITHCRFLKLFNFGLISNFRELRSNERDDSYGISSWVELSKSLWVTKIKQFRRSTIGYREHEFPEKPHVRSFELTFTENGTKNLFYRSILRISNSKKKSHS